MPEIIQDWLGTRLGILLDMTPQKFGRNTKDGRLLANVLYSYGAIPQHVFEKIKETHNFYECYNNLMVLKPWLDYIGVVNDDSSLREMAGGEGLAAISVFYAVYLNLERKDRLHYISAQKERKFSGDSCKRNFQVDWVPEREVMSRSSDNLSKLDTIYAEKQEMIDYHREKCKQVLELIKKTKAKFHKTVNRNRPKLGPVISKHTSSQILDKHQIEAEETAEKIKAFEMKHPYESHNPTYSELIELKNIQEAQPCFSTPNLTEAKNIVCNIKKRKKDEIYAKNFQVKMQNMVIDEVWRQIEEQQDKDFENTVCANFLKQSQYEKQMMNKLCMIRNHKKKLVENRKKIECLKIDQKLKEYDDLVNLRMEVKGECWEEEEFEKERLAELHRRLYDEKVRKRKRLLKEESQNIVEALIDIAVRVSEVRTLTGCQIPKAFMKDLKELFFKGLSIFDLLDNFEELCENERKLSMASVEEDNDEEEGFIFVDDNYERLRIEEAERQSILNNCDVDDYLNLTGPWMVELLFPDGSETEVDHLVLGYIVHKLLAVKYPHPSLPAPIPIKPMKPTAVVKGLTEDTACNMLIDLMEACRILVVKVDDAINFTLAAYKEELSGVDDIDNNFQKATINALREKPEIGKEKEMKRKLQLLKKEDSEKLLAVEEEFEFVDKGTQTPRVIPEEESVLSRNAEIGKIAFETLGSGDPVPDSVIAAAVVAYVLFKQDDYDGWVLLNYPLLYSQASELECALSGYRILPILDEMEYLEEVEGFTYRGPCVNPTAKDEFGETRLSRLVPRPDIYTPQTVVAKTYFDSFINVKKTKDSPRRLSQNSEEISSMEKFYSDQEILINFEYVTLSFQSVKNLAKAILRNVIQGNESNPDLIPKSSVEIFGAVVLELNEKWNPPKKKNVKDLPGKKSAKDTVIITNVVKTQESRAEIEEEFEEEEGEEEIQSQEKLPEKPPGTPRPGDPDWEWATGEQTESILLALASLWENMEAVYIEDFKNVFFCLRVHRSNVLSYLAFVKNSVRKLLSSPDEKQKVLDDFHQMFNEIDEDLRPDADIKCEMHVRVSELEQALMAIADERKRNFLQNTKKIAQDGWVADQMVSLVNAYLSALQLEADRCVDSCQVIMDYYLSLQQRIPDEKPLPKFVVSKLQVKDKKYSIVSSGSNKSSLITPRNSDMKRSTRSLLEQGSRSIQERVTKTRSLADRRRKSSSEGSFLMGAGEAITDILVNLSLPDDGLTPFHIFFIDSVHSVKEEVSNVVEACLSEAKRVEKVDKVGPKNTKKMSETKIVNGNLTIEWTTALENELSRFLFRLNLILARAVYEINEFLTTILNILSALSEEVTETYLREIQSISECCKVIRCYIEEEKRIEYNLELFGDSFVVVGKLFSPRNSYETETVLFEEDERKYHFTIEQLSALCTKLQRVAPGGEIIKRSMLYIFEDLRTLKPEIEGNNCFPEVWRQIEPNDLTFILDKVYQELEVVHWKDFIIYAMDLPVPSEMEILEMRRSFRSLDPLVTELVSREQYDSVQFWFDTTLDHYTMADRHEKAKDLLYKMYQVDENQTNYSAILLAFCKDENPIIGFTKALALAMGKKITLREYSEEYMSEVGEDIQTDYSDYFDESDKTSNKELKCCPSLSTEAARKCIPIEKMTRCDCPDLQKVSVSDETEKSMMAVYAERSAEEESTFSYEFKSSQMGFVTSSIPLHILSSLLKASYPFLPQLSILLDCKQTFQETLNSVFNSLELKNDSVEVHKLIDHKFINRLLLCTNKFKFVKLRKIFQSAVESRNSTVRTSCLDKLNVNVCLN